MRQNLHHLTSHSVHRVALARQHRDRNVTTDYCDVTSPYVWRVRCVERQMTVET